MKNILKSHYKVISEIESEVIDGLYLLMDKDTKTEYILKEILQKTTSLEDEIILREFGELVERGATIDDTIETPIIVDFFIEEGHKYLVLEACEDNGTVSWLEAFPSLGYIFRDSYVVVHGISTGGFGVVYQVRDAHIPGKYWALKEMYDDSDRPKVIEKSFRQEAEILAGLEHRCIPIIIGFFTEENRHYLVMEYIKGHTLGDMIDNLQGNEYLPEEIILEWAIQICEVLEYLHGRPQPVIFRDMKPDNIMITYEKELKLIDFGISCIFEGPRGKTTLHALLSEGYAPQEQWLGRTEPRSDIYSFGATLHHLITRIHPRDIAPEFPPPDQLNPLISRELSLVVLRALQPKPVDRYQTVSDMKKDLLKIAEIRKSSEEESVLLSSGEKYEEEDSFKALSEYMKVLDLNKKNEKAHYRLAGCYEKLGFKDKGIEHYKKALEYAISADIKQKSYERLKILEGEILEKSLGPVSARIMENIELIPASNLEYGSYLSPRDFLLTLRFGHSSGINDLSIVPGTSLVASAGNDKTIKIWDIDKKLLMYTLEGHMDEVNFVSVSSDGKWLASGSTDKTVKLWDMDKRTLSCVFSGYDEEVRNVAFTADTKIFVFSSGNKIYLGDIELRTPVCILEGHEDKIRALALSHDGRLLCSAGNDLCLNVWDLESKKLLYTLSWQGEPVKTISISPRGDLMAAAAGDKINIWDMNTKEIVFTLKSHTDMVETLSFSPDGLMLVSGGRDRKIKLWDIETGKLVNSVSGHISWITKIVWTDKYMISGSSDATIKLWDTAVLRHTFGGYYTGVEALSIRSDGKILASGNSDNTIKLWDFKNRALIAVLEKHKEIVSAISCSSDGKYLASGSWDEMVHIWDIDKGKIKITLDINSGLIGSVAFSPDGKYLATGGSDKNVNLWNAETGELEDTFEAPDWSVEAIAFTPDSEWLASGGSSNTISLWDLIEDEELATLEGHKDSILCLSFAPCGTILVSGSKDNTVKLWSIREKGLLTRSIITELVHSFEGHTGSVLSVCFNYDGSLIASGGKDNMIKLWDVKSCKLLFNLTGHTSPVTSLCFSSDGTFVISGSKDGTIKIWNLEEKSLISTFIAINKEGNYEYITYSPDNSYTCSDGGREFIVFEKIK
ncbi:MAG TPA: protein kinase [Candidatus Eremiobacteraeota bacterium]|nr:protein kinase [Candidatus Eremiobacteraeota bacterium]